MNKGTAEMNEQKNTQGFYINRKSYTDADAEPAGPEMSYNFDLSNGLN